MANQFNNGDGMTAVEVGRFKGEMDAIEQTNIKKNAVSSLIKNRLRQAEITLFPPKATALAT